MSLDGKRVLLIDDDPDMHEVIRLILEPAGINVTCYTTGPGGLEAMRRQPPDLVLLDIMLATPSEGCQVAEAMKADDQLKDIPIVMVSALGGTVAENCAEATGHERVPAEKFIDKPFEAATVLDAVTEVLSKGEHTR
jgi:CheY-like chemotaxis protein